MLQSQSRHAGLDRIFARSWYAGAGRTADELDRPLVAIANSWNEIAPENIHLRSVADAVKAGVRAAGGTPMEFGSIHTTDVIAMASEGMRYVLPSRELVADCVEAMISAHAFDAVVLIAGGDKVTPGMVMGALRTGVPAVYVYAGTTEVGWYRGRAVSWETVFEAIGQRRRGVIDDADVEGLVAAQMPGPGGGASAYTGNSMAMAAEALGLAVPHSSTAVAGSSEQLRLAWQAGAGCVHALETGRGIRDVVTEAGIRNAARVAISVSGSTNVPLHLAAIAHEAGVRFGFDEFDPLCQKTPTLVHLRPSGAVSLPEFHRAGGVPTVLRELGDLIEDAPAALAPSTREIARAAPDADGVIVHTRAEPVAESGGLVVLRGSLAPRGALVKAAGVAPESHRIAGPARVYECEEDACVAIYGGSVSPRDVVVIRNEGPRGGPGFREMLGATAAIVGMGLESTVALVTDGRFSGASHGAVVGYISPEAASGGPIGLVQDGDRIEIDIAAATLELCVADDELRTREGRGLAQLPSGGGLLTRYAMLVSEACDGAVLSTRTTQTISRSETRRQALRASNESTDASR